MRLFNGRLVRHTLGFSKDVDLYRASAAWEDAIYNLVRPLKTLRVAIQNVCGRRWQPWSPAMAAGLTDHLWTVKELLTTIMLPNTRKGDYQTRGAKKVSLVLENWSTT